MLSETLKEETKNLHVALEKAMVPRIKGIRTPQDYIKVLDLFYSYFGGLEKKIEEVGNLDIADYSERRKKEAIAADILSLGGTLPELTPDQFLPEIDSRLKALGALYVMEGSTLGGLYISKMIANQLGEQVSTALSFFDGYGEQTAAMWDAFKSHLDAEVSEPRDQAEVIQSANETFLHFRTWIDVQAKS